MDEKGKEDREEEGGYGSRRNNAGKSEDGRAEMENCGGLCEEEYGGYIIKLERWMEEKEKGVLSMIRGDFNARTGEEGGGIVLEREIDR